MITTINPSTGDPIATYEVMQEAETGRLLNDIGAAFELWRRSSAGERRDRMNAVAGLLRERKDEHARLISLEMGKPLAQSVAEVLKCAWVCEYYAEHAESFLSPEESVIDGKRALVTMEPLGVILGVMPWNFPYWQVFRFAAPAIMAGNGIVLKHAPNVTGCAVAIEQLFRDAGFPPDLYRAAHFAPDDVDRLTGFIIDHPVVRAASVTGSSAAGRAVASKAGQALKRSVLELGGSDPYLVLDDADLALAVDVCVAGRLLNAGQSCISAKRFIVHASVAEAFTESIVGRMSAAVMGDPFAEGVDLGPVAREDLRLQLHFQVERSVAAGASLLCGGFLPEGPGWFYPPTVLAGVRKGMPAWDEELFGPVAVIIGAENDDEAVSIANDSLFGLGSAVFSSDVERAMAISGRIESGTCFINSMVKSDPRLPFGGVKQSGYGRELSHHGIREFVNIRSIYLG